MIMKIERNNNGKYRLLDDEGEPIGNSSTGKEFETIEKINDQSNYYCLWKNDVCFYLLHVDERNARFVGGAYAWGFNKITNYSDMTGSFAAYRSDAELAVLLYEDFYKVPDAFLEIGEECDNEFRSRPVKYTYNGIRWCFFQTKQKQFAWRKEYGYIMPDEGMSLYQLFPNSYYSVLNEDGYSTLAFYNPNENRGDKSFYFKQSYNHNYKFKSIKCVGKYIICESIGHFFYVFNTRAYEKVPLCSSISKPIIGKGYIVLSDGDHHQIFKNDRIIENDRWSKDCQLKVKDDYVFCQNGKNNTWKIYWLKNGKEIYTGWKNIYIDNLNDDNIKIIVDTNDITQLERASTDILPEHQRWLESLCISQPQRKEIIHQTTPSIQGENGVSKTSDSLIQPEYNSEQDFIKEKKSAHIINDERLPDHIDFIVAMDSVKTIKNEGKYIDCDRKCDVFKIGDVILWYDKSACLLYVTIYRQYRTHKILITKESVLNKDYPTIFTSVSIKNVNEQNLIDKLHFVLKDKVTEIVNVNKQKIRIYLTGMGFNDSQVKKAIDALYPTSLKETAIDNSSHFTFNEKDYSLKPNDIWNVENPFFRQKYLLKKEFVAILIEKNFIEYSSEESIDYELKGQGNDKRFDQDFITPVNRSIRDNTKRILLFKKIDNCLLFFDEVKCVSYAVVSEDGYDINSRKIIKFYLRSLIKYSSK